MTTEREGLQVDDIRQNNTRPTFPKQGDGTGGRTVGETWTLIDEWIEHRQRRGYSRSTISAGRREVTLLAEHLDGALLSADHREIMRWLDDRRITNPESRRCYLSHLSAFYRWAIREQHTATNPVDRVDRPRRKRRMPRPIPLADLDVVLDNANPEMRALLLCGLLAGLRCQEMAGLDREDVLEHHQPPTLFVSAAKGGHERTVPLHPALFAALRLHGLPRRGPLFLAQTGARRTPSATSHLIRNHFLRCGVDAAAHRLRHTYASNVLDECHDLRIVQELLGHQSPEPTAIYAAFSTRAAWSAVQALQVAGTFGELGRRPGQASEIITRLDLPDDEDDDETSSG